MKNFWQFHLCPLEIFWGNLLISCKKNLAVSIFSIPVPVQAVGDSPSPALEAVWKTSGPHLSSSATAAAVPVTSMPTNTASGWQPLIRTRTSLQLRFKKHWRLATRGRECLDARSAWRPRDLNSQYKLSNKFKKTFILSIFFSHDDNLWAALL